MVFAGGERIIIVAKRHRNYSFFILHYSLIVSVPPEGGADKEGD